MSSLGDLLTGITSNAVFDLIKGVFSSGDEEGGSSVTKQSMELIDHLPDSMDSEDDVADAISELDITIERETDGSLPFQSHTERKHIEGKSGE